MNRPPVIADTRRSLRAVLALAAAFAIGATLIACTTVAPPPMPPSPNGPPLEAASTARPSEALDRAEMMSRIEQSAASWNRADLKGHLAIYDESVTVMTKEGPRPTIAAIESAFGAAYFVDGKPKQTLRFERPAIRMLSTDSALMTGRFVLYGGGLAEQSGWFTLIWVRTANGWRVVHDHTS